MSRRGAQRGLGALAALLWAAVFLVARCGVPMQSSCSAMQLDAYARMQAAMEAVKAEKVARGITLSSLDLRDTGMIGEEYNGITTTLGALEAKRTTADPNMAALLVRMFQDAGLSAGDRVGAGFSGSFPALNLAVLAACDAMGLEVTYISSVGASTYGANNPQFTFPEMAHSLVQQGLLSTDSALVTMGGDDDIGEGMDETLAREIKERLRDAGLPLMQERDYAKNVAQRKALYAEAEIACFVAVGGNTTSLGQDENAAVVGQGLLENQLPMQRIDEKSGLVQWYRTAGIPVINLLNIKQIVADYGLPFDPTVTLRAGESAVFYVTSYPRTPIATVFTLAAAALLYLWGRHRPAPPKEQLKPLEDCTEPEES